MVAPVIPFNEKERIQELYALEILDTSKDDDFTDIVKLASQICNVPISVISLLDVNRQWFKAKVGLDLDETPRAVSFCAHLITQDNDFMEVIDATQDKRFYDNPLVTDKPNIRFYAGSPIVTSNGNKMGTLCVIDTKPNHLTDDQVFALKVLGRQVSKMIEEQAANKKLQQQAILLKQQSQTQKMMLSIIAQDIRNPVGALKSAIELMESENITDEERKNLNGMFTDQLDNTLELLNNLVDWGNMQTQQVCIKKEKQNLKALVEEILGQFQLNAIFKNNRLLNLVDEDLFMNCDSNMLRFIVRNLIGNANKFTQNGMITVYAHGEKNSIVLSVSDTGVGMAPERVKNLFNKTYHESTPGTNKEKGSGLGLLLTKDFIDTLGATIQITSEVNKGTTMYLYFTM